MAIIMNRLKMMSSMFLVLLLVLELICFVDAGNEKRYCDVCRALVEEANWKISQSDPKRKIQVGSFRVDPNGNQNIKEKTFARSEGHIEEIFDTICDELKNYAELSQEDGTTSIVRTSGRLGKRLETKDLKLNYGVGQELFYQCHNFLENHEEIVMGLLQREGIENYEQIICGAETSVCSGKELIVPLIQLPEAVEEDIKENDTGEENAEESEAGDESTTELEEETDTNEDDTEQEEKDEL